jgi:hypothetical protein
MAQYALLPPENSHGWPSETTLHSPSENRVNPFADSPIDTLDSTQPNKLKATVQCCKCDETQDLFSDWSQTSFNSATCRKCTAAFCGKCSLAAYGNVTKFDRRGKLSSSGDDSYHWICLNCGVLYGVPTSAIRQLQSLVSVQFKSCICEPCNQRATSDTLFLTSTSGSTIDTGNNTNSSSRSSWVSSRASWTSWTSWTSSSSGVTRSWSLRSIKRWNSRSS